jgi:hypothetical protein
MLDYIKQYNPGVHRYREHKGLFAFHHHTIEMRDKNKIDIVIIKTVYREMEESK